jgi:PAS domain S-box-containing protein
MTPPTKSFPGLHGRDRRPVLVALSIMVGVFVLDLLVPLGNGLGALYVIPLLVLSVVGPYHLSLYAAWLASVLIVIRVLEVPPKDIPALVFINRVVALIVVWATAAIVSRLGRASRELARQAHDLEDIKYAIDQSAIVATTNTQGRITYVNDKFCEISKYTRSELLGQDHRLLNSGYHPKDFIRTLWTTIANGHVWRGEIRNRAKDGSLYWVDTTIVPFLDGGGKPYQYTAIRYEVTGRKKSEEQLREQAALTRLGEMAAVVAHEVKNPIAGIRGALQVILSRMPADQRDRAIVVEIIGRLDSLGDIVRDLLLYARPAPPKQELVDIKSLIESTGSLLRRDPSLSEVTLEVKGESRPVQGDAEQLRVMFQNLIINAAQAMGGRGAIHVDLACAPSTCEIAIRDHGPGMPPDVLAKAFDAFFTTKHRGTGLGLAIARRVVEAHGGRIDIDSRPGNGTTVSVTLPASQQAAA